MFFERRLLAERGVTQLTLEGFMARVDSFVRVQIGHIAKTLRTVSAAVGALLATRLVTGFVHLQRLLVRKTFVAHRTLEAFLLRVRGLVGL